MREESVLAQRAHTYSCKVRAGRKGTALRHVRYILRKAEYRPDSAVSPDDRGVRYNDLIAAGHANLPSWAVGGPETFFAASDRFERANGTSFRSVMFALPRALSTEVLIEIIKQFCEAQYGDRHGYSWALHNPKAAIEGGDQPHVHVMFCERIIDARSLGPERYFKTWNRKCPERGGYRKAGWELTKGERRRVLIGLRKFVADLINEHLAAHRLVGRITHESFEARGLAVRPEKKDFTHLTGRRRAAILRARELRNELVVLQESVRRQQEAAPMLAKDQIERLAQARRTRPLVSLSSADIHPMPEVASFDSGLGPPAARPEVRLAGGGGARPGSGDMLRLPDSARPTASRLSEVELAQFAMFRPRTGPAIAGEEDDSTKSSPDEDDERNF